MTAPLQISAELAANVQRMRGRRCPDAVAFETGEATTWAARARRLAWSSPRHRLGCRQARPMPATRPRIERRRMLGGSSALPPNLRANYTEGQRSVLCIVAGEVKRHGICDLAIDQIAARAGVSRTTVQNALRAAAAAANDRAAIISIEHRPVPGRKSKTNIVRVVSADWLAWIARAPSLAASIGFNSLNTSKNIGLDDSGDGDKRDQTALPIRPPPSCPQRCPSIGTAPMRPPRDRCPTRSGRGSWMENSLVIWTAPPPPFRVLPGVGRLRVIRPPPFRQFQMISKA